MTEPKVQPLLTGNDEPFGADVRTLLEARSGHEPTAADLASLGKRLAAALPPGTLPPASTPTNAPAAPAAVASSTGAKVLLAVALGGAIAGGVWLGQKSTVPATTPSTSSPAPAVPASAIPASAVPASASSERVEPVIDAAVATAAAGPSAARTSVPSVSVPTAPPEATILARAHDELLHGAAEKALASTVEHARAYPNGSLAQEREVIAIEALVRLGRREEARRRAAAFHRAYAGSSHGARIDRLVEGP